MDPLFIASLPIMGVILGAFLTFWFGRISQSRAKADELRLTAYVDYLKAVSLAAHQTGPNDLGDALQVAADAKTRIAVYGSSSVLRAIERFEVAGPSVSENPAEFIAILSAMRGSRDAVSPEVMSRVILGIPDNGRAMTAERSVKNVR